MTGRGAALLVFGSALAAAGCKKQAESLVLVSLTATDSSAGLLPSVTVSVASTTQTFQLSGGLSGSPVQVGLYVPADLTGSVRVSGNGTSGGICLSGTTSTNIAAAGSTVRVPLSLTAGSGSGCSGAGGSGSGGATSTGGSGGATSTGGSGGATSTGGSGGATSTGGTPGTGGAGVTPPSLTRCTEYDHNDVGDPTCDDQNGIANWEIWSVAFSPDGKYLASAGDDGRVKIWSFDGHALTASGHVITTNGQTYVAFTPDSSLLLVGAQNGSLTTYNVSDWTMHAPLSGVTGNIRGVAISQDGKTAITIDDAHKMYAHSLATAGTPLSLNLGATAYGVAISPVTTTGALSTAVGFTTGRAAICGVSGTAITSQDAWIVEANSASANTVLFSPDGKMLAIGDDDGRLAFWSLPYTSATPVGAAITFSVNQYPVAVNGLSWSSDGVFLAVAAGSDGGYASIWKVASRTQVGMVYPKFYPVSVALSPSGSALAAGEVTCGKVILCAD